MTDRSSEMIPATLVSYVPLSVSRRLAADPTPIAVPSAEQEQEVCLLLDIAGFTPLTERLAQRAAAGAEELARILNKRFGAFVEHCSRHGGEVVGFAGDALQVIWWARGETIEESALRATGCALGLLQVTEHAADGVSLSVKITMSAGELLSMQIGGADDRKRYVVAGAPIERQQQLDEVAVANRVVVDGELWELLGGRSDGEPIGDGFFLVRSVEGPPAPRALETVDVPAAAREALAEYLAAPLLGYAESGSDEWLAQFRRVTSIFVRIEGIEYATTAAAEELSAVVEEVEQAVQRYDATVHSVMVGEKGTLLLIVFGLPPHAHEDDAARGVMSAIEIEDIVEERGLRSAIGVTTGTSSVVPWGASRDASSSCWVTRSTLRRD